MKAGIQIILALSAAVLLSGCFNFFHDLVPPDENRILSFELDGQTENAVIGENSVSVTLGKMESLHLIPRIQVSFQASLIPVTLDYIRAAFPNADIAKETGTLLGSGDLAAALIDLVKRSPGFSVPALTMPIDFSGPVLFFVISGQGNVRQYTVQAASDNGEPRLLSFAFSKYDNAELVKDGFALVHEQTKTVITEAVYPAEMTVSYALVPSFQILGDALSIDGNEIRSGLDTVQFKSQSFQSKTITVTRDGQSADYTLNIKVSEDPDTIRSITDFRFTTADNPGIAATAAAAIVNTETAGTITVQVFYSGAQPGNLKARFISPGTVSVEGAAQTGGVSEKDFSIPLEYRVVSKNGLYSRTYTVRTAFFSLTNDAPKITSFRFSQAANHDLVQDTQGEISGGNILIDAKYGGKRPEALIPEFTAGGLVTVNGAAQTSGLSGQDFTRQVKYTVSHPLYRELKTDYWVQARLVQDNSSYAAITAFGFYRGENPGLGEDLEAKIDQGAGTINVFAPAGSGVSGRIMIPRFTAQGQVTVNGDIQTSGASGKTFDAPVSYTVTSANGLYRKNYTVHVRELKSRMYVNEAASGWNDGSSWADAFTSLQAACKAAAEFPEDAVKEIWIAKGTYRPSLTQNREEYFLITPNTGYLGGFAGWETAKGQRNPAANPVVISGDLGGAYSYNLFAGAFDSNNLVQPLAGDAAFEDLRFTGARADRPGSGDRGRSGAGICAAFKTGAELMVKNCVFDDLKSVWNGGGIYFSGTGNLALEGATIDGVSITGGQGGGIYCNASENVTIKDTEIKNVTSTGSGGGIDFSGGGNLALEGVTIDGVSITGGQGGGIRYYGSGNVTLKDTKIKNVTGTGAGGGIYFYGASGNLALEGVTIDGVSITFGQGGYGGGIWYYASGNVTLKNTKIKNVTGAGAGGGIYFYGALGNLTLEGVTIDGASGASGGGIYSIGKNTTIRNSRFENCKGTRGMGGGALYLYGESLVEDTEFINCNAGGGHQVQLGYSFPVSSTAVFRRCTFTHNASLAAFPPPPNGALIENSHFINYGGETIFEDCFFNGLKNTGDQTYLFLSGKIKLVNCSFDFSGGGKQGLYYGTSARADSLDLDGCTITNYNEAQPLIRLDGSSSWRIRTNSSYNGTPLNQATVNGLISRGLILRENGAQVTVY